MIIRTGLIILLLLALAAVSGCGDPMSNDPCVQAANKLKANFVGGADYIDDDGNDFTFECARQAHFQYCAVSGTDCVQMLNLTLVPDICDEDIKKMVNECACYDTLHGLERAKATRGMCIEAATRANIT